MTWLSLLRGTGDRSNKYQVVVSRAMTGTATHATANASCLRSRLSIEQTVCQSVTGP